MNIDQWQSLSEDQFLNLEQIQKEYQKGMLALNSLGPRTVTFYGGAKVEQGSQLYHNIFQLAQEFGRRGWGVITGGGPGIMSAALEGVRSGGGQAIAFRINIPGEPSLTPTDVELNFNYFSVRKYMLRQSDIFIYAPGGLGTLDELMENLTLIKTQKYPAKPIFLYDKVFWEGCVEWFRDMLLERKLIQEDFLNLFQIVDNNQSVIDKIFAETPSHSSLSQNTD